MNIGAGEILLVLLLGFIAFGPRRRGDAASASLRGTVIAVLATAAPALLVMDRVGFQLKLPLAGRLGLAAASALATALTLLLLRAAARWTAFRDRRGR